MSSKTKRQRQRKSNRATRLKKRVTREQKRKVRLAHDSAFVVEEEQRKKRQQEERDQQILEAKQRRRELLATLAAQSSPSGRVPTPTEEMLYKILPEGSKTDEDLSMTVEALGAILEDVDFKSLEERALERAGFGKAVLDELYGRSPKTE